MKKLTSLLLLFLALTKTVCGQTLYDTASVGSDFDCTHVTLRNGLPHNFVDCVMADSHGFVWMGLGGGGLVRYDGYDFLQFSPCVTDRMISGNIVTSLREDERGRLWVGSDCGVDAVDIETAMTIGHDEPGHA